ncbi:MAG: hypothetical protein LBU65_11410 [Planctomycetaceae bacterium]|jgi:cell division septal protein FtsQ|nr:hypothetical protein [Planctomycetaceae bacterium]
MKPNQLTTFAIAALLIAVAVLTVTAWQTLRHPISESSNYRLDASKIIVPEQPRWVSDNIVEESLQNAGLDHDGSILDRRMPERLATALLAHPWVAEVQSVRLVYPNGAEVKLTYREPAAMVELNGGLLPVDKNGVLLRTDYFRSIAPEAANKFPRITGTINPPLGTVGTSWGDEKVEAAAYVAGVLQNLPPESGLQSILTENETITLQTKSGKNLIWGKVKPSKEPTPEDITKREKLEQIIKLYNNLDNVPQTQLNDLLRQ